MKGMIPVGKWVAVGAIAVTIAGCNKANSEVNQSVITPVKLVEIPNLLDSRYDTFIANIDATNRAAMSFQVAGEIEKVDVRMGSSVKKGEPLAWLDPTDYQLAYDAKNAEYALAKTAYQRAVALHAKSLISVDTYDQSETAYKAAKAAFEQAKTDLAYTQITAPFDGVVSLIFSKEHQVVGSNQPILNVIDNQILDVVFAIPVSYAEQYGLDHIESSSFNVVMDSHQHLAIPAKFKEISTQPDSDTNSYTASLSFERPTNLNLLPGMTAQVQLLNEKRFAKVDIASSAWISRDGDHGQLFKFDKQQQVITAVDVTLDAQGNVISGLNEGDLIVQAGVENLVAGQHVKAWTKEGGI